MWTTVKAPRDKFSSWSARTVANLIGVKKPTWMEMDQWWRRCHRTSHRWIEKCNKNVLTAIQRTSALLGWSRGQDGPLGNLVAGVKMSGTSVVEMATAPLERCGERQVGRDCTPSGSKSTGGRIWNRRRYPKSVETLWLCGTWLIHVAQDCGNGCSSQNFGKARLRRNVMTQRGVTQPPRGSKRTRRVGGKNSIGGFDSRRMVVVVAANGVDWRRMVDIGGTK